LKQTLAMLSLVVKEYDEAIRFYTEKLKFDLIEDTDMGNGKRWVVIAPPGSSGSHILLAKAVTFEQEMSIGNQTGGRVFLFLHTDDFWRDYHKMKTDGINFIEEPRQESYGTVVVFTDLYGNKWDFIQRNS